MTIPRDEYMLSPLMKYKYHKQYRYKGFDYSQPGYYFITICTQQRKKYFGIIQNNNMNLSFIGEIANYFWEQIPSHFENVDIDEYIIMPDHMHGIIVINQRLNTSRRYAPWCIPTGKYPLISGSLSLIINQYKGAVKRFSNHYKIDFGWQSRFYDVIIRNHNHLEFARNYIRKNVVNYKSKS